jgi:hypothetical protein
MVSQHQSTKSRGVEQLTLLPVGRSGSAAPDIAYLLALPTLRRAIRYSMSLADVEPKQIYDPLGKDKAVWSRIENGDMSFPADDLLKFCSLVGNDAALLWLAYHAGYDIASMKKRQDDKDRRIAELEAKLAESELEKAVIAKFVKETMR